MVRAKATATASYSDNTTTTAESNRGSTASTAHASGSLSAEHVRRACTTSRTQNAYRSYRNGITAWIRSSKTDPARYFEPSGEIDINVFTPKDFESFLLFKMNASERS